MKLTATRLLYYILIIILFSSCARNPVTGKKEVMLMSESQEIALGQQSDPAIIAQFGLYQDDELQAFINEKGKEMGLISHRPELDYQFRILDSPVVNAFAVPGGYIYFTRGIMAHFNNEAEFAGVLGHEIGHITARHSAKQYTAQMIGQLGLIAGVIASEEFRQFANEASQAMGLLFLKFGRDHESQSDELGVSYSTQIGYNSHEMADFFQTLNRLQEKAGASIPSFLSTHPNPVDRYNKVHQLSDEAQAGLNESQLKINRESYLRMIEGIVYGEDPRQGYTDNFVFYHPELKFQFPYPNGWNLYNSPSQVQIAPEDGKALILLTLAQGDQLQAAVNADIEKYGFTVIESANTRVNGFSSIITLADLVQTDPNTGQASGTPIRILNYYIQDGQLIYVMRGMSDQATFNTYNNAFKQTMGQFKRLSDPARINVEPTRIVLKTSRQSSSLRQALLQLGAAESDLEELAIINGMELGDQVDASTMLKLFSAKYNK